MDKSPLPKRQKLSGISWRNVNEDLEAVISLRKNTRLAIERLHFMEMCQLKKFSQVEVELAKIETCEVPNMDPIFQDFRTLSKEFGETTHRLCDHIPLLHVLEQKKNCPVAKIIDEI